MGHWNYRILSEVVGDYTEYYVAEVYYRDDDSIRAWTDREEFNALRGWDSESELRGTIELIQRAATLPVLRVFGDKLVEA